MILTDLIKNIECEYITGDRNIDIQGIAYNSNNVKEGDIFVCIEGLKSDGHKYISQAIRNGAAAIIIENDVEEKEVPLIKVSDSRKALANASINFFGNPASKLKLIGITGTNGKTTTTYLIKSILECCGYKVGIIGTNQNMIGNKILPTERTTPESFELQKLFLDMKKQNVEYVVMEVSSHSLELSRVHGCIFDLAIFTNITQDHLDFHKTMEKYLTAKSKLFGQCKKGAINIDDPGSIQILQAGKCDIVTYAIDKAADVMAKDIILSSSGVKFNLITPEKSQEIKMSIPGKFTIYNALSSITACLLLNIDLDKIKQGLLLISGVPGRIERVDVEADFTILIDYAHTPDGMKNIITTVKEFAKGRVITLFGCGGDRDIAKRPIMGRTAGQLSDFCIITSDNPRTEHPMKIIKQIEQGIKKTNCPYIVIENRLEAIKHALKIAKKDDVIILAGKGHEIYQEINGEKIDFDEHEIVKDELSSK